MGVETADASHPQRPTQAQPAFLARMIPSLSPAGREGASHSMPVLTMGAGCSACTQCRHC
ncbi:hypothetical protein [Reticulibacter mediterranei]|uniref:hypothetical protein n=1 Tax=Reticulibacter mediterranei TaxID=2778369 RepID=UPI001C692636|nr:hypothetical protein [Reticulibacter mediterranei]